MSSVDGVNASPDVRGSGLPALTERWLGCQISIIDSGHLWVSNCGQEGSEAPALAGWREAVDPRSGRTLQEFWL